MPVMLQEYRGWQHCLYQKISTLGIKINILNLEVANVNYNYLSYSRLTNYSFSRNDYNV